METPAKQPIVIVGAGLAGCMMALLLGRRGLKVEVVEKRGDWRLATRPTGHSSAASETKETEGKTVLGQLDKTLARSINLALSYRGIQALKRAGDDVFKAVQPMLIPMAGRVVHKLGVKTPSLQVYGTGDHSIYSCSRSDLNILLLKHADAHDNVTFHFDTELLRAGGDGSVTVRHQDNTRTIDSWFVIGCDGIYSVTRQWMRRHYGRADFRFRHIESGYKELHIPPTEDGDFAFPVHPKGLHIWPRHKFMIIALPNADKSYTCTLFAPFSGPEGLNALKTEQQIEAYFAKHFPSLRAVIPEYVRQYQQNPSSPLGTVDLRPWHYKDRMVLLGDAAHAIVPFYGQGMNAAFEDCLIFDELWEKHMPRELHWAPGTQAPATTSDHKSSDKTPEWMLGWEAMQPQLEQEGLGCATEGGLRKPGGLAEIFRFLSTHRQRSTAALAELSIGNYHEMRSATAKHGFILRQGLDRFLQKVVPSLWALKYHLVAFSRVPYDYAISNEKRQSSLLKWTGLAAVGVGVAALARHLKQRSGGSLWPFGKR